MRHLRAPFTDRELAVFAICAVEGSSASWSPRGSPPAAQRLGGARMRRVAARGLAATVALLALASCSGGDGGVVEAGDRLAPPDDWAERRELVVEKSLFCGGPAPCPHLEPDWDIPGPVTVAPVGELGAGVLFPTLIDLGRAVTRAGFSHGEGLIDLPLALGFHDCP